MIDNATRFELEPSRPRRAPSLYPVISVYKHLTYTLFTTTKRLHMAQSAALLTNLLNTLHSHLQSQTQLLPAIHVQLGLPSTALEDDLNALQQHLMQSVEGQIESRRKEVEDWLEKCDGVELECVKYSKALGGNIKATGTSVGELRKENVLPRRFEMVTEYQERLRQVRFDLPCRLVTIID